MTISARSTARTARLIALALLALVWASCKSSESPSLGGETNWFAWCASDADCISGTCVCGVCTTSCSAEHPSCAAGPVNAECFARGSFPYADNCAESSAEGVCLPACATDADCRDGGACRFGACSPAGTPPTGAVPPSAEDARLSALAEFSEGWFEGYSSINRSTGEGLPCSATDIECPTLEEVLSVDDCYSMSHGCGLYYVGHVNSISTTDYWYEGFGTPPIAAHDYTDAGEGRGLLMSRSVDCDTIETMCTTCDPLGPTCKDIPGAFPEPLPSARPEGCSCEPDGEGAARVSLDCFCSIYECPTSARPVVADCSGSSFDDNYQHAGTDACGQFWFERGFFNSFRFAFDGETGDLVAAVYTNGAPVSAPCNTYEIRAGATADCETTEACDCIYGYQNDDCDPAMWFGLLQR